MIQSESIAVGSVAIRLYSKPGSRETSIPFDLVKERAISNNAHTGEH